MNDHSPLYLHESRRRRRRLRNDIASVRAWLWRYVAPGWLLVLIAVCLLIIVHINATTAVLNTCGR